jgi:hypothetical protein
MSSFERFVASVKSLPQKHDDAAVLARIEKLYEELDVMNEKAGNGLLETDERELLVPIIIDIAIAAGVNPENYDGEPGGEFRNF